MKPKKFLVMAHHRSGTLYTSIAFEGIGLHVSHEKDEDHIKKQFDIDTYYDGVVSGVFKNAAYDLDKYDVILHQVRHPLDVISSSYYVGGRIANDNIKKFGDGVIPSISLVKHMKSWLVFTDMADGVANYTYQLENIQKEFGYICNNVLGIEKSVKFRSMMQKYNFRRHPVFAWRDLEHFDREMTNRVREKAEKYGYVTDDMKRRIKDRRAKHE